MRYLIKHDVFSLTNAFVVMNGAEADIYKVVGHALGAYGNLSFQDTTGNELAHIGQKTTFWGLVFEVRRNGELAAEVRKHFTAVNCFDFSINGSNSGALEAQGRFKDMEYTISQGNAPVAQVSNDSVPF